jgi:hypothetical protein
MESSMLLGELGKHVHCGMYFLVIAFIVGEFERTRTLFILVFLSMRILCADIMHMLLSCHCVHSNYRTRVRSWLDAC